MKETLNKISQSTVWEKMFATQIPHKGLIFKL